MKPTIVLVLLAGVTLALIGQIAQARDATANHKSKSRHAAPTPLSDTSPEVTGTLPSVGTTSPERPQVDEEALPPDYDLPTASRERMRSCGEKWQAKKLSGQAGDEIWRDFATKCLVAND